MRVRYPLNPAEARRWSLALVPSLVVLVALSGLLLPYRLVESDSAVMAAAEPPIRTPLPELCLALPHALLVSLVPEPRVETSSEGSRTGGCGWKSGAEFDTGLDLRASRPSSAFLDDLAAEAREAEEDYREARTGGRYGAMRPVAGLGDEAVIAVSDDDEESPGAELVVRDGLLTVQVTYRRTGGTPERVAAEARRAAAELLRFLPPGGH